MTSKVESEEEKCAAANLRLEELDGQLAAARDALAAATAGLEKEKCQSRTQAEKNDE